MWCALLGMLHIPSLGIEISSHSASMAFNITAVTSGLNPRTTNSGRPLRRRPIVYAHAVPPGGAVTY